MYRRKPVLIKILLIAFGGLLFLMLPADNILVMADGTNISNTIIRLIAFLLGMSGSTYLAACLWHRSEKGSESWKYLSVSMIMLAMWNIIMAVGVMLTVLNTERPGHTLFPDEFYNRSLIIIKILDPVILVFVFLILFFGLKKIINAMRNEPWEVFSKEEQDE